MHPYLIAYRILMPRRYRHYLGRAGGDVDMCHECLLHGTFYEEYCLYGFAHKDDRHRRLYLTDAVRDRICRQINGREGSRVVMDKYRSYERLKEFYHRKVWSPRRDTAEEIVASGMKYGKLVCKPVNQAGGRGVSLLTGHDEEYWRRVVAELLAENFGIVFEEVIAQDSSLSCFNTSSVNTVRMNTIFRNGQVTHFYPFIRTGRQGSFVDNGAQGGLFASIDAASGIITTQAYDEKGKCYDSHPDSGTPFRGFQIPLWDDLLAMTERMAHTMPDMTYIGWDMALAMDGWCCVEANKGEFVAQQLTLGRGLREEFESLVFGK